MKRREIKPELEAIILEPYEFLIVRNLRFRDLEFLANIGKAMKRMGRVGPEYPGTVIILNDNQDIESLPFDKAKEVYEFLKAQFEVKP